MSVARYYGSDDCRIEDFEQLITAQTRGADVPRAASVEKAIPVYLVPDLSDDLADPERRTGLMGEWAHVLRDGAGVLVLRQAVRDHATLDAVTGVYLDIIAQEKAGDGGGADHFAAAGANDRIWNSLQKLCFADPERFALYFGVPAIDAVAEAWLGPGYQMTAQVNLVRPGGTAQEAHRDYHLGFQTAEVASRYPAHVHHLSPVMTLQGGIAHCDMPVESGPTKLLPFSQTYGPGYMAYRLPEFREVFEARCIQLPLAKGDAIFFNPALFHAAGENRSNDIQRMANLLQVSSAFGRAMESIDRSGMCRALYPVVSRLLAEGRLTEQTAHAAIAAAAEGYSFPTNLDTDPPESGLAPQTQAQLFRAAIADRQSDAAFFADLAKLDARRAP